MSRLGAEFRRGNKLFIRNPQGLKAQREAVGQGVTAADDALLVAQAYAAVSSCWPAKRL